MIEYTFSSLTIKSLNTKKWLCEFCFLLAFKIKKKLKKTYPRLSKKAFVFLAFWRSLNKFLSKPKNVMILQHYNIEESLSSNRKREIVSKSTVFHATFPVCVMIRMNPRMENPHFSSADFWMGEFRPTIVISPSILVTLSGRSKFVRNFIWYQNT